MKNLGKTLIVLATVALSAAAAAAGSACDKAIVEKMFQMYELDTASYHIEIISNHIKTADVDAGDLAIRPLTQKEPLGLFSILVQVSDGNNVIESSRVRMKIRKYGEVVVLADRFKRHELFHPDRLAVRRMDITNLREQPVADFSQLAGYRAKRNIRKGIILTLGAIEPIPDIELGAEMQIVYDDGLCRVTAPGVALQSGLAGEYIKVKNKATNKIIMARVIDDSAVAVGP